jgi:hypothetical protein
MAIEDHPLYPQWKIALERLVDAKARMKRAMEMENPNWLAERYHYTVALGEYVLISEQI